MKKHLLSFGLMLLTVVGIAQVPESGLIAYYPLGMTFSTTSPFTGHDDISGNGYHLAVSNGFGFGTGRTSQSGEAAEFNNYNTDVRTYDYTNDQAAFKQTGNFTISVWVRLGSPYPNEYQSICVLGDNDIFLRFRHDGTGNYFIQGGYRTGASSFAVLNQVINTADYFNTWKLITLRRTGSQLQIFSNTTQISTAIFTTNAIAFTAGSNNLYLGSNGNNYAFTGRLQDLFYYNRSISTPELEQLVCSAPNPVDNSSTPYQNICTGTTVQLNATVTPNTNPINWYTTQLGGSSILTGGSLALGAVNNSVNYYVDATASNGCVSYPRVPYEITVNNTLQDAPVNTTPAQNLSICAGNTTTLTATAAAITWYDAPSGGSPLGSGTSFTTPTLSGNTTFYAQNGTGACASVRTAIAILVDAPPAAPAITTSTSACGTHVSPLQGTASGPISWYDVPTGGTSLGTGLTYSPAHPNPAAPGQTLQVTYYGETVSSCGVSSARTPVTITINYYHPAPVITTPIEYLTICPGATATISASGTGNLVWASNNFPWPVIGTGTTVTTPALTETESYSVNQSNGCGDNVSVMVTVALPAAPTNTTASGSLTICAGSTTTLTATGSGTLKWYDVPSGGSPLGTGGTFATPALSDNTTYYVEADQGTCTSDRTAIAVTVNAIPAAPTNTTAAANLSICEGETTTLTAIGAGTLRWYDVATGGSPLGTGGSYTTPVLNADATYYVSRSQSGCTSASRTAITVTVNEPTTGVDVRTACDELLWIDGITYDTDNSTATFVLTNAAGCDSTVTLNLTIEPQPDLNVNLDNGTLASAEANASYQWVDCDNGNTAIPNATAQNFTPTVTGNYAVELGYGNGCTNLSSCTYVEVITVSVDGRAETNTLNIYPNPFNTEFIIETAELTNISVMNAMGEVIRSRTINGRTSIDATSLSAGIYFVREETSGAVMKLVKN